ncbi:hypothetical protein [Kitasatospora sp. LaBMicrA B282]|uniref:hypothetical protein n=1 Tax=Kitasatospora sp. LaBMicrA B282 TaxID=3420949 RepID=UPI003D12C9F9
MERQTVVRCVEGHLFSTKTWPLRSLGAARLGPGRLIRCPQCGRLRSSVPADVSALTPPQLARALRLEAAAFPA